MNNNLKYFACPNVENDVHSCGPKKVLDIISDISYIYTKVKFDASEDKKDQKQVCTYQVRGPVDQANHDQKWLNFIKVQNAKITVIGGSNKYEYVKSSNNAQGFLLANPTSGMGDSISGKDSTLFVIIEKDLSKVDFTSGQAIESTVQFEAYI